MDFDPAGGHEQGGIRPAVVVSAEDFNAGPTGLAVMVPFSTRKRGTPLDVAVQPPEGGLRRPSFIKCEDVRSVAFQRLIERWGQLSTRTMALVEDRLRILLEL